ncbi:hypothetical protein GCK72_025648 [Caenorhabditis remanei]|uniref:Uncharacterized protein n=1 Tax=Caenorhabditis remanei TaxID=31234 RepID=A0A6A5G385_CAERE|nr:hypothetical protein GCK72_025648 [Caenorhabditis remanei]KAF1749181.1 hypothetical protein GCK72_025648 [Caenorhabditis remanei]
MLENNSNINPNSLRMDKELTQMARNIARRIQQRIGEVEKKASDLDSFSREVSLRVGSVGSKMANLKHHKVVKQVVSTQNIQNTDDMAGNMEKTEIYTPQFLEALKNAIINAGKNINSMDNPAVFDTGHIGGLMEQNGYTNGHHVNSNGNNGYHHAESSDGSEELNDDEYESDEHQEIHAAQNGYLDERPPFIETRPNPIGEIDERQSNRPSSIVDASSESTLDSTPEKPAEQQPEPSNHASQNPLDPIESAESSQSANPTQPLHVSMRPAAMASVIGEMREKVAARPKFFDSDSDSDTEPLQKPSTSQKPVVVPKPAVAMETKPASSSSSSQQGSSTVKVPTSSEQPTTVPRPVPPQTAPQRKVPLFDTKPMISSNIFDSDSETDTEYSKPPPMKQEVPKAVPSKPVAQIKKPAEPTVPKRTAKVSSTTKPMVGKSLFSSDSDSDDDFLKSFTKPAEKPKPVAKPVTKAEATAPAIPQTNVTEKTIPVAPKAVDTPVTKPIVPPVTRKVEIKKPVTQSLFDDSDSDSDLFSTASKPKLSMPPKVTTAPPKMEPSSSDLSEQTESSRSKKEPTSEKMSAKISLIADLQKSFRLPGTPLPMPVKNTSDTDEKEETPTEEELGVSSMLKSRCRGPPNRRPPTRSNVSK